MRNLRRRTLLGTGLGLLGTAGCGSPSPDPAASTAPPTAPTSGPPVSTPATPVWDDLAGQVSGGLARPGGAGYDAEALLYNPRFSAAPAAIAACRTSDDVVACVRFAAGGGAELRLRNGGHSYGGWSAGEGLVADLSGLDRIEVDPAAARMRVGAGALLIDVYAAAAAAGVAVAAGSCPTVGLSGLTLGGGVGVLTPGFGLTCDQVVSVDVVTADGDARTVGVDSDDPDDADLFWALRGGGAGIAAVTGWTFAVRPAPTVTMFYRRWSFDRAADVLAAWQDWLPTAPREIWSTAKLLTGPDGARVQVSGAWTGSGSLDTVLSPLLAGLPQPAASTQRRLDYGAAMAYAAGCSGLDAAACRTRALDADHRRPFAATSSMLNSALPEVGIQAVVESVAAITAAPPAGLVEAGLSFDALGGAVAEVAADATAFPWRDALATVQHTATWTGDRAAAPAQAGSFDAVVTRTRETLSRWTGSAAYVNYADATLPDRARACWGDNVTRLRSVVAAADPDGVFASPAGVGVPS